jgi:multiple sugar transport system substrate-binding protein
MRIFVRIGLAALVLCLAGAAAVASGVQQEAAEGPVEIQLAISPREVGSAIPDLIAEFEEQNPSIDVSWLEVPGVPNEQRNLYVTNLVAGSAEPDVMALDIIWPGEFIANGWTTPLNDYFSDEELSEFLPGMMNAVTVDGQVHAVPLYTNAIHFFYRQDLLDKYDLEVPTTWSELEQAAKTVLDGEQDSDLRGYISMWAQIEGLFMNYLQFLWGAGGSFFDDAGNVTLDTPEGRRALQQMVDMLESGVAPQSILNYRPNDAMALFRQGRAVFMVVQGFVWPILTEEDSPVRDVVEIGRVPWFEGNEDASTHAMGGWVLAINPNSPNRDAAAGLIRHLTTREAGIELAVKAGSLPARVGMNTNQKLLDAFPTAEILYRNFEKGNVRPSAEAGAKYPQLSNIVQQQVHAALNGLVSVEEALEIAQSQIEDLFAE